MKKLSIIIPVFNEEATISLILDRIVKVRLLKRVIKEIIIVNDFSNDNSDSIISDYIDKNSDLDIKYFKHKSNRGKGSAINTGIKKATGDFLIIQDADLEYDPREYNRLLGPILDGVADVVYGSRFMGSNPHRILFFWHTIGNKFLTTLSNMFTNLNLTDIETCYKLFDISLIKKLELKENRFGIEPEITAKISRVKDVRIFEVGISYYGRTYEEGKKIGWKDGFEAIYCILKYNIWSK